MDEGRRWFCQRSCCAATFLSFSRPLPCPTNAERRTTRLDIAPLGRLWPWSYATAARAGGQAVTERRTGLGAEHPDTQAGRDHLTTVQHQLESGGSNAEP